MSEFLNSVKSDLLDRRMLPMVALIGVALAAALAYAVLGGGGSPAPAAAPSPAPSSTGASGIAVSLAPTSAGQPVAETTSGASHQRGGSSRNPFAPLPGATAATTTAAPASSKAATSESSTTSTKSGSATAAPETPAASTPKSSSPAKKPRTVYQVAVLFGIAPAGTPPQSAKLTPYVDLKRQQPLPSSTQPLIVFRGVIAGAKSATFTLVGEAILRGTAACLPSPSQCQAIDLKPGQTEELEYLAPTGAAIVYQLQVVSITSSKATTAAAKRAYRGQSKSGTELLRHAGLVALPGLRYSNLNGVLVFAGSRSFAARAHAAARRRRHKR